MRLSPQEYADNCWEMTAIYIKDVQENNIIVDKYIKLLVNRIIKTVRRKDLDQKAEKVEKVFKFFSILNLNIDNKYQQFRMQPFQALLIFGVFSPYHKDTNTRLVSRVLLWMGRKNGKTAFAAALQLYFLVADGQTDPQAILVAWSMNQAQRAFDFAQGIVKNTPELGKRLKIIRNKIMLKDPKRVGFLTTVPGKDKPIEGFNISAAILDEVHTYVDEKLYTATKKSTSTRENPIILIITSAGSTIDSFCNDFVEYAKNILEEKVSDDSLFPMLYTLDSEDDPEIEENWIKSNPGLGTIKKLKAMKEDFNTSKNLPVLWNEFLIKDLNVFYGSTEQAVEEQSLVKARKDCKEEDLLGRECYLGLDLSATQDLTSLVAIFPDEKGENFDTLPYFFFPNKPEKMNRKAGIGLRSWIRDGQIIQCSGKSVDYGLVLNKIEYIASKFNVLGLGYDPWNSSFLIPKIEDIGIEAKAIPQNFKSFNFPLKYLFDLIYNQKINLTGAVLLWNIRNIVLSEDGNDNIKIMKNKSKDAVDGAVSLTMALKMWIDANIEDYSVDYKAYADSL